MPQNRKGARLWLRKGKNGRDPVWVIKDGRFRHSTGYGIGERDEAEEALADYIHSRRPDTNRRHTDQIQVSEVLNLYQIDLPKNSPSRELVGYHVANLLQYWGGKSLAEVKGSTCREYLQSRTAPSKSSLPARRGAVSASTVRRELKTMSAAINHWHKESPLVAVPQVTLPEEGERRERVLERSEVARMLRACRKRKWNYVARFILMGIGTGTRSGAIVRLRWEASHTGGHCDLARGILYRRGAGERETSKRRPPVQIRGSLASFLARWREMDRRMGFPTVIHHNGTGIRSIRKAWRTIREDAGLGLEVTPHVLRHTCASWMLWNGKTVWDVAGVIGADASTVERVYGHHRLEAVPKPVRKGGEK